MNDERSSEISATLATTSTPGHERREGAVRRQFLRLAGCAVLAPLVARTIGKAEASAARLSEADPTASSLGYRQDASQADAAKYPKRSADQVCGNCKLSKADAADDWIPCTLYAGKLVNAKGWCAAWSKRDA